MRLLELADKLRARGVTVREVAGWQTRGNEFPSRPDIALRHWTAGPLSGLAPSLGVCTYGRGGASPLPGPLCQVLQSREVDANGLDVVHVVASGKANHAGEGVWNGVIGNYASVGLEIEWSGPGEQFVGIRRRQETSELVMRALLDCCAGTNPMDACEHREYAPTRKIDTNLSGGHLRDRMADLADHEGDDELSAEDVRKINERLDRLDTLLGDVHLAVYGADLPSEGDNNPRHQSIYTGVKYLRGEVIGGKPEDPNSNLSVLRRIFDQFRVPDKTG